LEKVNYIEHSDALDWLKSLPDNSVGLILTDPPYGLDGLGRDWKSSEMKTGGRRAANSSVATRLPKGMKFDRKQSYDFYEFYVPYAKEAQRILKPGGWFLSFSAARLYHRLCCAVEDQGFEIRDMIAWIYPSGQAKAQSQAHFIRRRKDFSEEEKEALITELEGWKTPMLRPTIEPICFAQKPKIGTFVENWVKHKIGYINVSQCLNNGKTPTNTISSEIAEEWDSLFLVKKSTAKEKGNYNDHPSVKPLDILTHLIKLLTLEEEIVADPFMGSGSTAVAAKMCNRHYIGCDRDEEYLKIANKRLEEV